MVSKTAAFAAMVGIGMSIPAAAWIITQPALRPLAAHTDLVPEIEVPKSAPAAQMAAEEEPAATLKPKPVRRAPRAKTAPEPPAEVRCYWHNSQTLATGSVRVCDIERSGNHRQDNPFSAAVTARALAPRDVPSPTGLTR